MAIEDLFGSIDMLQEAAKLSKNAKVQKAIEHLKALYKVLCDYHVEKYVSFDLGMLSSYQYYTGIIFKVYTIGIGDVVAKGGRYDKLLPYFGKNSPAIGFVIVIDDLMQALKRQKVDIKIENKNILLVYDENNYAKALQEANKYRKLNIPVALMQYEKTKAKSDYEVYAKKYGMNQIICLMNEERD